jgi:hypothetical protein
MITHLLNSTVSIERAAITIGDDGAAVAQWHTHLVAIKARVQPRGSQNTQGERPTERRRLRIYVDRGDDIALTDRITYHGDVYTIEDVRDHGAYQILDVREHHS